MKNREVIAVFIIILFFILLASYKIDLPGLYEDEAFQVTPALEVLKDRVLLPNLYSCKMLGKRFPLMLTPFSGAFNAYILIPIIHVFGLTVKAIRMSQIFFAALGIFLTYYLCRKLFDKNVAIISAILLAINPSFVLFNRQGLLVSSINLPIAILGILMISWWHSRQKKILLYGGFFLLGLPLFNDANFFWLILALSLSCLLVFKKDVDILFRNKRLSRDDIIVAFYFLLLGAAPFIWYNIQHWETIGVLTKNLIAYYQSEGFPWYFKALRRNIEIFIFILSGAWNAGSYGYSKGIINHVYPILFFVSLISTPLLAMKRKNIAVLKKALFLILTIVFILLQSPFSLEDASAYNLYILYPFVQVLIALFIIEAYAFLKDIRVTFYLIAAFFALLGLLEMFTVKGYLHPSVVVIFLIMNLWFFVRKKGPVYFLTTFACLFLFLEMAALKGYYNALMKTGGTGHFSNAIYSLADFAKSNKDLNFVAMDWGFRNRLLVLTDGEVDAKDFDGRHDAFLKNIDNVYMAHAPYMATSDTWDRFGAIASSRGIELKEIKRFYQRDKKPVIFLYKRPHGQDFLDFDFIKRLSEAKIETDNPENVGIKDFSLNGDTRRVIFQHPLSKIAYSLKVPFDPVLKFSVGISDNCWDRGDGVLGEIYLISDEEAISLFSKYLNPHFNEKDRKWLDYEIDLSKFSGKDVDILFKTFPGPISQEQGDYEADWWGWGNIAIVERH